MSGGRVAGPMWLDIMKNIYDQKGFENTDFKIPSDIIFRDICTESGELATDGCRKAWRALVSDSYYLDDLDFYVIQNVAFKKGTEPVHPCHLHERW